MIRVNVNILHEPAKKVNLYDINTNLFHKNNF